MKKREKPIYLKQLDALHRRTRQTHSKFPIIKEKFNKNMAGYKGECSIDYPLSFLPEKQYLILHDLRLPFKEHFFQIDTLLLSTKFIVPLEIKNIAGKLMFDSDFHQLIRTKDSIEEAFLDPLLQISRQKLQLRAWLEKNKLPDIPINPLVIISNPSTIIESNDRVLLPQTVIHRDYLPIKIKLIESSNQKEMVTNKELTKVAKLFIKQHTPKSTNVLNEFDMKRKDLITGVHCLECGFIPMNRVRNTWFCNECGYLSKDAHLQTLIDYQLLIGPTITNRELREFLGN